MLARLKQFSSKIFSVFQAKNSGSEADLDQSLVKLPTAQKCVELFLADLAKLLVSHSTLKNYSSDILQFIEFSKDSNIRTVLSEQNFKAFFTDQQNKGLKPSSIQRKIVSLKLFSQWVEKNYLSNDPQPVHHLVTPVQPVQQPASYQVATSYQNAPAPAVVKPAKQTRYQDWILGPYFHLATLVIFFIFISILWYRQFFVTLPQNLAFPAAPVDPERILSFQARLTDVAGTPITTATNTTFRLYNAETSGTLLWNSGTCSIDPDQDGIFSTILGETCGSAIDASVFTENNEVWLEIQVVSDTLTPRQRIASVPYALNSGSLQGFPIDATVSATKSTVLVMNQWGEVLLGENSPDLRSVSGTFTISGNILNLVTNSGSNGNIILDPDGTGQILMNGNVINDGYLFTHGATISATYSNSIPLTINGTGGQILTVDNSGNFDTAGTLTSGTGNAFTVDASGNIITAGTLAVNGDTITSDGDLTINPAGGNVLFSNNTVLNIGGAAATAYNFLADSTAGNTIADGDSDLYIQDELEVDGAVRFDNASLTFSTFTTGGGLLYTNGSGVVAQTSAGSTGECLTSAGGATPTWSACSSAANILWRSQNGALSPITDTYDLLLGSNATASAKFAFMNVNSGTPTASISANSGNIATYLTGTGNLQTTNAQTLAIGGSTTGDITMTPRNGVGSVTIAGGDRSLVVNSTQGSLGSVVADFRNLGTNPGSFALLDIRQTTAADSIAATRYQNDANGWTTGIDGANSDAYSISNSLGGSFSDTKFTILTSGNTGIGDATPASLFTVGSGDLFQINSSGRIVEIDDVAHVIDDISGDLNFDSLGGQILFANGDTFNIGGLTGVGYNAISDSGTASFASTDNDLYIEGILEAGTLYVGGVQIDPTAMWKNDSNVYHPAGSYANVVDFVLGGVATSSAKFAVLNVNSGTPTASLSANSGSISTYIKGDGTLATTNRQTLTIGNSSTYNTTGNVLINPNGTGFVGIGTTTPGSPLSVDSTATQTSGTITGINQEYTVSPSGTSTAANIGLRAHTTYTSSNTTETVRALFGSLDVTGTGNIVNGQGILGSVNFSNGVAGDINDSVALDSNADIEDAHADNATSLLARLASVDTGSIDVNYGIRLVEGTKGIGTIGTEYGINIAALTNATNNYGIWGEGGDWVIDVDGDGASGGTTGGGDLFIGEGQDLNLYHDGTNSVIDNNTGNLNLISAADFNFDATGGDIIFSNNTTLNVGGSGSDVAYNVFAGSTGGNTTADSDNDLYIEDELEVDGAIRFDNASLTFSTFTANGGLLYTNGSGVLAQTAVGNAGECLASAGGGAPTWTSCSTAASVLWRSQNGALSPINDTYDLLLGSNATSSAEFAVTGINSGTPTASVSAISTGTGLSMAGTGVFQTTRNNTLTIGGATTGDISLLPLNGAGNVTADLATSGILNILDGNLKIGNASPTQTLNGEDAYIEGNLEVDGNLYLDGGNITGPATLTLSTTSTLTAASLTDFDCADCIDWDDIIDISTIDANSEINLSTFSFNIDMDNSGDFSIRDGSTAIASFTDLGAITFAPTTALVDITGDLDISDQLALGNAGAITASQSFRLDHSYTDTSGTLQGIVTVVEADPAGASTGSYLGISSTARLDTAQSITNLQGMSTVANVNAAGTLGSAIGLQTQVVSLDGAASTITNSTAFTASQTLREAAVTTAVTADINLATIEDSPGSITNNYGVRVVEATKGTGTITNQYGISVQAFDIAATGTNYGLQINDITGALTNNFALVTNAGDIVFNEGSDNDTDFRVEGASISYLLFTDGSADTVGIGGDTTPDALFSVGSTSQFQVNTSGIIAAIDGVAHTIEDIGGDISLNSAGGQINFADTDTFNIGGVTNLAYNAISDSGTATTGSLGDDDLYIEDILEVDGAVRFDNASITMSTFTANGGLLYTNGSGVLAQTAVGSNGECLKSIGGGTPTWGACGSGGSSEWTVGNGAIYPNHQTVDLLIGSTATGSAEFAVTGIIDSNPVASISAISSGTGLSMAGTGVIQTTRNNTLTIGGATTGDISLLPLNGAGQITADLAATGLFNILDGNLKIGNASPTQALNGEDAFIEGNLEIDGNLYLDGGNITGPATLTLATTSTLTAASLTDFDCADCIDWDDIADTTALDASTSIGFGSSSFNLNFTNNGSGHEVHNLTSTGDILWQDSSDTVLTLNDTGNLTYEPDHDKALSINSTLSGGTRATSVLSILNASDVTFNMTDTGEGLIKVNNQDAGSTSPLILLSNVSAGGTFLSLGGGGSTAFTGNAINISSIVPSTGNVFNYDVTSSNNNIFSGDVMKVAWSNSFSGTQTASGNFLDIQRTNAISSGTLTMSGDLVNFQSTCSGAGTCTDTANILSLAQNYTGGTGAVLDMTNAGTGQGLLLTSSSTGILAQLDSSGAVTTADGLLIRATNGSGIITDALDASDAEIVNALNAGANFILGDGIRQFSSSSTVWTFEDTSGNDLCTITDLGTTGSLSCTGGSAASTLQQTYDAGSDSDVAETITLTAADDSIRINNPTSAGTTANDYVLSVEQLNTTDTLSALDIVQASNAFDAVNLTADAIDTEIGLDISVDALTTGTGIQVQRAGAGLASGGELINLDMGAAVGGNGLNIVTTGVYTGSTTTEGLLNVTATALTTGVGSQFNFTGLTSGSGLRMNGSGTTMTTGGEMIDLALGANTVGAGMTITSTGTYTGTGTADGLINVTANSLTTGYGSQHTFNALSTGSGMIMNSAGTIVTGGELLSLNATGITTGRILDISTVAANTLTTGQLLNIGSTSTALTTGSMFNSSYTGIPTAFAGGLNKMDWSPTGSTEIFGSTGSTLLNLNIGQYGNIDKILRIQDNASDIFSVSQALITNANPAEFTAAGDVSIAYDIQFTNQTSSFIKANGPLTIDAGESFENNDLTMVTYGTGALVVEASGGAEFNRRTGAAATFNRNLEEGTIISIRQDNIEEGTIVVTGSTVTYTAFTGSHYATTTDTLEKGELVTLTGNNSYLGDRVESEMVYGVEKSSVANDPQLLGAYLALQEPHLEASSTNPHLVMAVGNGVLWVVDEGQNLIAGEYLISSDTPGHAMKDTAQFERSFIVARVAENVDWSTETAEINGKKHKLVSVFYESFIVDNEANLTLSADGSLSSDYTINSPTPSTNNRFSVISNVTNQVVTSLSSFAQLVAGEITAGLIRAQELVVNKLTVQQELITPKLTTNELTTNFIAPQNGDEVTINIGEDQNGELTIENNQDQEVLSIDQSGNTEIAGNLDVAGEITAPSGRFQQLEAQRAQLSEATINNATVSGQLYLQDGRTIESILSENDAYIASISAQTELITQQVQQAPSSMSESAFDQFLGNLTGTNDASISAAIQTITDQQNITLSDEDLVLAPAAIFVKEYLNVSGYTQLNSASVQSTLTVGNNMLITNDTIAVAGQTLFIQPSGSTQVNILAGLLVLDPNGNIEINGNLIVNGDVNIKQKLNTNAVQLDDYSSDFTLKLATQSAVLGENTQSKLSILDAENSQVASIDASGSGKFKDVSTRGLTLEQPTAEASDSAGVALAQKNETAGSRDITALTTELTIENNNIDDNDLIYLTPTSDTANQVLYIKSKETCSGPLALESCQKSFTVGIKNAVTDNITFNYWIVKIQ